jgi:hypothetical protein
MADAAAARGLSQAQRQLQACPQLFGGTVNTLLLLLSQLVAEPCTREHTVDTRLGAGRRCCRSSGRGAAIDLRLRYHLGTRHHGLAGRGASSGACNPSVLGLEHHDWCGVAAAQVCRSIGWCDQAAAGLPAMLRWQWGCNSRWWRIRRRRSFSLGGITFTVKEE